MLLYVTWVGNRSCGDPALQYGLVDQVAVFYLKAHNKAQVYFHVH